MGVKLISEMDKTETFGARYKYDTYIRLISVYDKSELINIEFTLTRKNA